LQPKGTRSDQWLNACLQPPGRFVASAMDLAMMTSAQWHGELIACFASQSSALGEAQMVRIGGPAATD
jgi:hypothetical protein